MLQLLIRLKARHRFAGKAPELLLECQIIERIIPALFHCIVRALNTFQHLTGGRLHHGLFMEMTAENQPSHFFEIFVGAISVEQEATYPVANQLIMAVRIFLERLLRLGEIALAAFLHQMPFKLREQTVGLLADHPIAAVGVFIKKIFARRIRILRRE